MQMHGWEEEGGQLKKTFDFDSYAEGLIFAMAVGRMAEKRDHHPDMLLGYKKLTISLSTHSAGGITEKDVDLAGEIDSLV